ncbi:MAG: hypothetical protein U1E27_01995, partial [Kiritimatiellia bacterium]|nr:hypothetical protein [Kiritimatiellia bacterium]
EFEYASFAWFHAGEAPLSLQIEAGDLTATHGGMISRDQIVLRYAEPVQWSRGGLRPDALPLVDGPVPVGPGTTRAFWICIRTSDTPAGDYTGVVTLSADADRHEIVLRVRVLPVSLPRPMPLTTYNWPYHEFAPIAADPAAAARDLAAHYIDTAPIHPTQLPRFTIDDSGNVLQADYARFDEVVRLYMDAGIRKFIFFSFFGDWVGGLVRPLGHLAGGRQFPIGTPEWENAIASMTVHWLAHLESLGLSPEDCAMYPIDEPTDPMMEEGGIAILKQFKKADPRVRTFITPHKHTSVSIMRKMANVVDIWCPHLYFETFPRDDDPDTWGDLIGFSQEEIEFFRERQKAGDAVHLYNCQEPSKSYHPIGRYRRLLWLAWHYGWTGAGHWAYADTGRARGETSAWTDLDGARRDGAVIYDAATAPAHVTRKEAQIPSRRWEAWRDGVEDYAYLWLLRQERDRAAAAGQNAKAVAQADALLQRVAPEIATQTRDPDAFNAARIRILETIVALRRGSESSVETGKTRKAHRSRHD